MEQQVADANWLTTPGDKVMLDERFFLYCLSRQAYHRFRDKCVIVNIGVSRGSSVHVIFAAAPLARIVALDISYRRPMFNREAVEEYVEFIEADSRTYQFDGPIHLIFIDGCHEYDYISKDIANWIPHIPVGGFAMFHDYDPAEEDLNRLGDRLRGVKVAVDEWQARDGDNWQHIDKVRSVIAFERIA